MNAILVFSVFIMSFLTVQAQEIPILVGNQPQNQISVAEIAKTIRPGQIVVMGELHGLKTAQQGQVELLQALRGQGLKVSVGLEFFYYPDQAAVDSYRLGSLDEAPFLKQIQWGSPSFDFYRDQAVFPRYDQGEKTLALNAPRTLTGRISKVGLGALTPEEQQLLPPQFQVGRDSYKKRFLAMMPHLPNPESGERYFAAQSVWDDTMAWKATEFIQAHPDQVLVIVVGDFHAQYGGGLPDRIAARTGQKPVVFSYVTTADMSEDEIRTEIEPSAEFGPRADYIWLTGEQPAEPNSIKSN
jgi:uncharacterized iron-regulated protein